MLLEDKSTTATRGFFGMFLLECKDTELHEEDALPITSSRGETLIHVFFFISNTLINNTGLKFALCQRQISENIAL